MRKRGRKPVPTPGVGHERARHDGLHHQVHGQPPPVERDSAVARPRAPDRVALPEIVEGRERLGPVVARFMACPPRNCPPSSRRCRATAGPRRRAGSDPRRWARSRCGRARAGRRARRPARRGRPRAATRFSPLPFLASARMRSRSPFQSAWRVGQPRSSSRRARPRSRSKARRRGQERAVAGTLALARLRDGQGVERGRARTAQRLHVGEALHGQRGDGERRLRRDGDGGRVMLCTASTAARSGPSACTG